MIKLMLGMAICALQVTFAGEATAAQEQRDVAPANIQEVVVTGRHHDAKTITQETQAISAPQADQIPQFQQPVCPFVVGLPLDFGVTIVNRIREIARQANIPTAPEACAPNLTVIVADGGATFLKGLHQKDPQVFDSLSVYEINDLLQSPGPSWSWKVTRIKRRDGGPVTEIDSIQFGPNDPPRPVSPGAVKLENTEFGRLIVPSRQDIEASFVVIDLSELSGFTLKQIADYSAMSGLAAIRQGNIRSLHEPSILKIFSSPEKASSQVMGATDFDIAYLTGLYASEGGFTKGQKIDAISNRIRSILKQ